MRIQSTLQEYLCKCEAEGRIIHCSREVTMRIDNRIAEAFLKASEEAQRRQLASFEIMKNKSLKGNSLDYSV